MRKRIYRGVIAGALSACIGMAYWKLRVPELHFGINDITFVLCSAGAGLILTVVVEGLVDWLTKERR